MGISFESISFVEEPRSSEDDLRPQCSGSGGSAVPGLRERSGARLRLLPPAELLGVRWTRLLRPPRVTWVLLARTRLLRQALLREADLRRIQTPLRMNGVSSPTLNSLKMLRNSNEKCMRC